MQRVRDAGASGEDLLIAGRTDFDNHFLTRQTVHDDQEVDDLAGGSGRDWIFANLDPTAKEWIVLSERKDKDVVSDID